MKELKVTLTNKRDNLGWLTVKELKELCRQLGIKGFSKLSKLGLAELIRNSNEWNEFVTENISKAVAKKDKNEGYEYIQTERAVYAGINKDNHVWLYNKNDKLLFTCHVYIENEMPICVKRMLEFIEKRFEVLAKPPYNNHPDTKQIIKEWTTWQELLIQFVDIAKTEGLVISKSPYSDSFYAHDKSVSIDWGTKPIGSYRLSDHWNWYNYDVVHCPTVSGKDLGLTIAKMTNEGYKEV